MGVISYLCWYQSRTKFVEGACKYYKGYGYNRSLTDQVNTPIEAQMVRHISFGILYLSKVDPIVNNPSAMRLQKHIINCQHTSRSLIQNHGPWVNERLSVFTLVDPNKSFLKASVPAAVRVIIRMKPECLSRQTLKCSRITAIINII